MSNTETEGKKPRITIKKKKRVQEHFTKETESMPVPKKDIKFKRCSEGKEDDSIKFSLIRYLQNQAEKIILGETADTFSFWYNLDSIITGWKNGDVHVAIDSEANVYGYILGDDRHTK